MTPTLYELDAYGEATRARHYCTAACRALARVRLPFAVDSVDEPNADIADGEVCDECGIELERAR